MSKKKNQMADYLRMALALQGVATDIEMCDRIIRTYKSLVEKGGDFTVSDAVDIQVELDKKWAKIKLEEQKE